MIKPTPRQLQRPIALLKALRDDAIRLEQAHAEDIDLIEPGAATAPAISFTT
jgi:hypothetical protein